MADTLVYLDTNVFIYFFQDHPEFGGRAQRIFTDLSQGKTSAVTSVLTLLELMSLPGSAVAIKRLRELFLTTPFLTIAEVSLAVIDEAARLRRLYTLTTPDAIHLATAIHHRADRCLTNDKGWLRVVEARVMSL